MTIEQHDPDAVIKVVPMYLEGEEPPVEAVPAPVERVRTRLLGILALAFGVLTVAALIAGMVIATGGNWPLATIVAYGAIGLSSVAVVVGVVAVILGRGRRWAVIAVLLGVFANPLVLLTILRFFGGFETG